MALGTLLGAHSNSSTCHLCKPYYDTFGSGGKEQKRSRAKGGGDRGFPWFMTLGGVGPASGPGKALDYRTGFRELRAAHRREKRKNFDVTRCDA